MKNIIICNTMLRKRGVDQGLPGSETSLTNLALQEKNDEKCRLQHKIESNEDFCGCSMLLSGVK